jgi:FlaA1/EpsC-like NDP-sugar epimerase
MDARPPLVIFSDEPETPVARIDDRSGTDAPAEPGRAATWPGDLSRKLFSRWSLLCAASAPLFAAIYFGSYELRFEGEPHAAALRSFAVTLAAVVLIKMIVFGVFGIYRVWSRFVTFHDLITLIKAGTASSLLISLVDYLLLRDYAPPRSVFLMDWGLTIVVVGGMRSLVRFIQEHESPWSLRQSTPVFIVGANDSGETLLRAIRRNQRLTYRVVGFIAEDARVVGTRISGIPVLGTLEQTCALARQFEVGEVLITAGDLSGRNVRNLVEAGREAQVAVKVLPSYEQLLHGTVDLRPRQVSIEDLLRREPAVVDTPGLHRWIDDRVFLVTGSAGSIGSEMCRQLLQFAPRRLVLVDRSETGQFFLERELRRLNSDVPIDVCLADLLDEPRMRSLLSHHRPDVIFHAAAYKHVPLMEAHPSEAVKNIVAATRQLADLAHEYCRDAFVMISTDKAVNPTSMMGVCKRAAELYVQALSQGSDCRFVTVRFGNVLDSAGSVVPIFRQQIAEGGPVTVTHPDMRRYFMTIPEAARLVLQAGAIGNNGHILLLDMGEPVRIVDLAEDMIRLSGLRVGEDVAIEFSGLRPGEKLFEELHLSGEQHRPTAHPKIIVVDHQPSNLHQVTRAIEELRQLADEAPEDVPQRLAALVPEYVGWQTRRPVRRIAA